MVKPRVGVMGVMGVDGVVCDTSLRWRVRGGGGVVKREYGDICLFVVWDVYCVYVGCVNVLNNVPFIHCYSTYLLLL